MSTFAYSPTEGAANTVSPKIRGAEFGDGYQQRVIKGINSQPRSWSLTFVLPVTDIDAIELFLQIEGGVTSFDWTPPSGSAGKFVCGSWNRSEGHTVSTLTATFNEVFGE